MVWQQGPAGVPSPAEPPTVVANVPMPLARPSDLTQILGSGFANVPLPPSRPIQVASVGPMVPSAAPQPAPVAAAVPPPLPPVLSGNAVIGPPGSAALAYAAAPTRSATPQARPAARAESVDGPLTTGTFDRSGLDALFATATIAPTAKGSAAVTTTRTRTAERELSGVTAKPATTLTVGFTDHPAGDLQVDHFSGPAVKAVPVVVFAKR
jgi:hypothetical protein